MENTSIGFRLKLGTFEKANGGPYAVCEVVTVEMRTPLNSEVTSIVMSVVADTNVPPDVRGAEIGKLLVCTSVTRWLGKRPAGVTPYEVPTHAVDNIPGWMLDRLVEKAQQLYNESMKEDPSVVCSNNDSV